MGFYYHVCAACAAYDRAVAPTAPGVFKAQHVCRERPASGIPTMAPREEATWIEAQLARAGGVPV